MTDSLLKNDNGFIVLNDGTSQILLNAHTAVSGVTIEGTHATIIKKRRTKLINVEFTFWLISSLVKRIEINLLDFGEKLNPYGIWNDKMRKSFVLPLTELRQKLKQFSKAQWCKLAHEEDMLPEWLVLHLKEPEGSCDWIAFQKASFPYLSLQHRPNISS